MRSHSTSSRSLLLVILFAVCLTLSACGRDYTSRMNDVLAAMDQGDTQTALDEINALVDRGERNKKPERNSLTLLMLERGTIELASGNLDRAAEDFSNADQMLEILDLTPQGARNVAAAMFSGNAVVYHAPLYEKLMVNMVSLAAYLANGKPSAAAVEARRLMVLIQYFEDAGYEAHPALSLAYALAGYALANVGEANTARKLYESAIKIDGSPFAEQSLRRLRGEKDPSGLQSAVVMVLSGQGPVRVPKAIPIGVMMGWLTSDFPLSSNETKIIGDFSAEQALSVIRFPVMETADIRYRQWIARSNAGGQQVLSFASDTNEFAEEQWREMRPAIAMNAISRWLTRHIAQTALGKTGEAVGGVGGGILRLAGLATKGAMMAADIPDTRAWNTIPGALHIGYVPIKPGTSTLSLLGSGPGGQTRIDVPVDVREGQTPFVLVYSVH